MGSGIRRIVLFRFHQALDVCVNRLKLLRRLNRGTRFFGLYGGRRSALPEARRLLSPYLEHVWEVPLAPPEWKWRHGDLSLARWYLELGRQIPFDMLHLLEWDLLLLGNLDEIFGEAGTDGVALAGLTPLERIERSWSWTAREPDAGEWVRLREHVRERHGWNGPYFACQGPANAFSKAFLKSYSREEVPELVHEELRIPLYAQALGFPVTPLPHIYREIGDPDDMVFFNCEGIPIEETAIRQELAKPEGRRVFHPYRELFQLKRRWWPF